jgi:hypothetical protein
VVPHCRRDRRSRFQRPRPQGGYAITAPGPGGRGMPIERAEVPEPSHPEWWEHAYLNPESPSVRRHRPGFVR